MTSKSILPYYILRHMDFKLIRIVGTLLSKLVFKPYQYYLQSNRPVEPPLVVSSSQSGDLVRGMRDPLLDRTGNTMKKIIDIRVKVRGDSS